MNALTHQFQIDHEIAPPAELALELPLAADLATRWEELHVMASEIGRFGQLGSERVDPEVRDFALNAAVAPEWRRQLADRGLGDLIAVLRPGLTAMKAIEAEGRDPTAAAVSLWREFHRARQALLDLVARDVALPEAN